MNDVSQIIEMSEFRDLDDVMDEDAHVTLQ